VGRVVADNHQSAGDDAGDDGVKAED